MNFGKKILILCGFPVVYILLACEVEAQTFKSRNCDYLSKKPQPTWTHKKTRDHGELYVGFSLSKINDNAEKQIDYAKTLSGNKLAPLISIYVESEFFSFQIIDQKDSHHVLKNIIEEKSNTGVYQFLNENRSYELLSNEKDCIFWVTFLIHKKKISEIKRMIKIENRLDKVMELLNQGDSKNRALLKDQKSIFIKEILRMVNSIDFTIIQRERLFIKSKLEPAITRLEILGDVNLPPVTEGGKIQLPEPSIIN